MSEKETVFLVDDDPSVLKGLRRLLTAAGLEVCAFESPREFREPAPKSRWTRSESRLQAALSSVAHLKKKGRVNAGLQTASFLNVPP